MQTATVHPTPSTLRRVTLVLLLALLLPMLSMAHAASDDQRQFDIELLDLMHTWAEANYQAPKKRREAAFAAALDKAQKLVAEHPDRAEPLVWEAIIRAGYAGAMGGVKSMFKAMPQVKQARDLLLKAEKIDPAAGQGAIPTTLGSLYYMVPGWPVGFGDKKKAREYLQQGLALAPDGMDANYFMGDFLLQQKDYAAAVGYLQKALAAADDPARPVYSAGRRKEIQQALATAKRKAR